MFSITSTYILYNSLLLICPLLCYVAEIKKRTFPRYFAYFILMFIAAIRFDIGADYENYYGIFTNIADTLQYSQFSWFDIRYEPITYLLTYLFLWTSDPSACTIGFYSILSIFFFYKVFDYYKIHTLGIAIYCLSFTYFQMWDGVRQGLAIAICVYSIKYIKESQRWKFFLCILVATLTHYSALLMIVMYPLRNIKVNTKVFAVILFIILIIAQTGLFSGIQQSIYNIMPYYSGVYRDTKFATLGGSTYSSTIYILTMVCYVLILYITPQNYSLEATLIFIGGVIWGLSGGNLNMDRVAWYFTAFIPVLLTLLSKSILTQRYKFILIGVIILFFIVFNRVYIYAGFRGCVPYETVFSAEYQEKYFRERDYK